MVREATTELGPCGANAVSCLLTEGVVPPPPPLATALHRMLFTPKGKMSAMPIVDGAHNILVTRDRINPLLDKQLTLGTKQKSPIKWSETLLKVGICRSK